MNKLVGGNDDEGIPTERPGILGGLAVRLQEGLRATLVALRQSHAQRLAAIVETSNDAILSVDLDGNIATWNRGAENLLGYTADEVIGKPITMLVPAERQHEVPEILGRIGRGESVQEYETQRLHKNGSSVAVSLSVSPILDAGGTIIGASKIGRDITERKRAEENRELLLQESHWALAAYSGCLVSYEVGWPSGPLVDEQCRSQGQGRTLGGVDHVRPSAKSSGRHTSPSSRARQGQALMGKDRHGGTS